MNSIEFGFLPGLATGCADAWREKRESKMGDGVSISANAPASQTANSTAASAVDTAQAEFGNVLQQENSIEDIFTFIRNQAGFEQGARTPPTFNSPDASPFGTAAHAQATAVRDEMVRIGVKGADSIYSEVAVNKATGTITKIGGSPIKGHHNLDLVATPKGHRLSVGQTLSPGQAEVVGDIKYGGGKIKQAHSNFGKSGVTVNSSYNSTATAAAPKAPTPGGAQKSVHLTHLDADVDPATGRVVAGPNTDAAMKRRAQLSQNGAAETVTAQKVLAPKAPAPESPKTASLAQAAKTEQATTGGQGVKAESTSSQAAKVEQAGAAKAETSAAKVLGGAGKVAGTVVHGVGVYATAGGTYAALKGVGDDIREGHFGSAALGTSAYLGGAGELGAMANVALTGTQSTLLVNGARVLGAPALVVGTAIASVQIGTHLYNNYVNKEGAMEAGDRVEAKTGSRVLGGVAAAGYAVGSAAYHAPEAAVDYVKNNVTLNPSEIDWDRTLKPWKWF